MEKTLNQFSEIFAECKALFEKKHNDYGTAWRILRMPSLTDQIYIKAVRIRNIQELGKRKVEDNEETEFIGIINYSIMAMIQLEHKPVITPDFTGEKASQEYEKQCKAAIELLSSKNYDYGEAWREMRVSSITDLIIQKLFRIKSIENNSGNTTVSEGLDANYLDIINYAVFALILLREGK